MSRTARAEAALFRLWFPTVFGASMLVVEIPVVSAAAARSTDGGQALAAIGIGVSILVLVNSPALALAALVSTQSDRRSRRQLRRYTLAVGGLGTAVLFSLASPPGSAVVRTLFDLDTGVAGAVAAFFAGLALNSLGVAIRRYQHGRLIHHRRTGPIVLATGVRLASTTVVAWTGVAVMPSQGPLIAGVALAQGAFLEAAVLQVSARRLPASASPATTDLSGLIARHAHLSAGRLLVMAPTVITTIGIAHATQATESLIVWPVLLQLVALFTSPTTDWESVAATAVRSDPRDPAPGRLTRWLAVTITGVLALAFVTGPADLFVRGLLAVPEPAADLGLAWAWILVPLPAVWLARAYFRGVVMARDATRWVAYAGAAHAAALVTVLVVLIPTGLPGVACAAIALTTGVLTDAAVVGGLMKPRGRGTGGTEGRRDQMTTAGEDPVGRPVGEPTEVTDTEINEALENDTLEEKDLRGRKIDHRDADADHD